MDRREFHRMTVAALGGMVAGTTIGCGTPPASKQPAGEPVAAAGAVLTDAEQLIIDDPHTCRGLNSCKNKGRGKENACAGQGTCASVADHTCGGNNDCKGQGGCGDLPGMNSCKGRGACHVPLMEEVWPKARTAFETAMTKTGKTFGAAPEAKAAE